MNFLLNSDDQIHLGTHTHTHLYINIYNKLKL